MDCGPTDGNSLRRTHPRAIPRPAGTHSSRTELHAATRELLETAPDLIGEFVRAGIQAGGQVPAHAYLDAQQERQHFAALWARFFDRYDLLLTPGAAITAFGGKDPEPSRFDDERPDQPAKVAFAAAMLPANVTGQPALAVPGALVDGLPIGLQIIGSRGDERSLLRAGMAYEQVRGSFPRPRLLEPGEREHSRPGAAKRIT
jgi:Asp-tRNA(Asn)/Glu-tRNA(Gln) amidotransferase A subunit family amidase